MSSLFLLYFVDNTVAGMLAGEFPANIFILSLIQKKAGARLPKRLLNVLVASRQ